LSEPADNSYSLKVVIEYRETTNGTRQKPRTVRPRPAKHLCPSSWQRINRRGGWRGTGPLRTLVVRDRHT